MPRSLVLFIFGAFMLCAALGCAQAPRPVSPARPREVERAPFARAAPDPVLPPALATACRAERGTVYGEEPVVFELQGAHSAEPVALELQDQRGQVVQKAQAPLPGQWRPTALPSGDFRLAVPRSGVTCWVTVNRELSRATEAAR